MPVNGYDDYKGQTRAVSDKAAAKVEKAKKEHEECVSWCAAKNPPPDPAGWGAKCVAKCDKKRDKAIADANKEERKETEALTGGAIKGGFLLRDPLIITDSDLEDFARTLRVDDFAKAKIVTVDTVAELRAQLAPNRGVGVLTIVTRLRKSKIDLGGESVSLTDLAGTSLMRVSDYVDLQGPSDGSKATGLTALKNALQVGAVRDKWKEIVITVAVDPSDKNTVQFPSVLKTGDEHFVTVVGPGVVTLVASVPPDVDPSEVRWFVSEGTIKPEGLRASISRTSDKGVVVEVRARGAKKQVRVWVVTAVLNGKTSGTTAFGGLQLGKQGGRDGAKYVPQARIDWIATIKPGSIITDADRPAIEAQDVHKPPGETAMPKSQFCGWEVAGQIRTKTSVGPAPLVTTNGTWTPGAGGDRVSTLVTNPYKPQLGPFGASLRWDESVEDIEGVNGSYLREKKQCLLFVRVQLGDDWRICSTDYKCRWHLNATRAGGKWDKDTHRPDQLDLTNAGW